MSQTAVNAEVPSFATFRSFAALLAQETGTDPVFAGAWGPDDRLDSCLVWDSLALAEVTAWLDGQGVVLPDELLPELITLGDLYHYANAPGTRVAVPDPRSFGRGVLEPLGASDEAEAFALLSRGDHLTRFRLRGTTPSPETFHHHLWDRVLVQFAVRSAPRGPMEGLVTAFDPDLRNRHVHLAAVASQSVVGTGLVALAAIHTVDYLFREFDLRKVYAETLAPNLEQFASGAGRRFEIQGRLREHEFLDGAYQDVLILATTREMWTRPPTG